MLHDAARAIADSLRADAFARAHNAAHSAATSPWSGLRKPTPAQLKANRYRLGPMAWAGLTLMFENAAGTVREGMGEDGRTWRNVMKAHYGDIAGTRGADGDPVDVFLGPMPESRTVWVINQRTAAGTFDEHKVLAGFPDEAAAVDAYRLSYMPGWSRYGPPVRLTLDQLRWWLRYADTTRELTPDLLPPEPDMSEPETPLSRVLWDSADNPQCGLTLDAVLYRIRVHDAADGLLVDPMTLADLTEGVEVVKLDSLVTEAGRLLPKMNAMLRMMAVAGNGLDALSVQITDPVRRFGGVHVAALFELSDGQTITIWFHNPDSTPTKLSPADKLVSWKWQLNKKDITIVVAPENGDDLNMRDVARRVMRLAAKNSAAFARANGKRAERMGRIQELKGTLAAKQSELAGLMGQIEVAKVEKGDREAAAATLGTLPEGWTQGPNSIATNPDPVNGGIIDKAIKSGKWFIVANDETVKKYLKRDEEFDTRAEAIADFMDALAARDEVLASRADAPAGRALAIRQALVPMGWEGAAAVQSAPGTMEHVMLKRDGDVTLKIKTVQSDGNVLLYLARMEGGALVADLELPDDTGRSPEENAKLAASLVSQLKADPSPIQPGTPDYVEWEDALTRLVEERDEATRSDAQGMVEAQDMMNRGILRKLHGEGKTPEEAYAILWPAGEGGGTDPTPPEPGPADGTLFDDYVEKVTRALEAQGMTTSDAQGVVGAAMDRIRQLFADGVGPTSAARGLGDVVQPAATAPAEAEFLRKVKAGAMDALPLGELFGQIEAAVQKLADAGLLTGEVETDANEALTHWVELDEKANG